MGGTARWDLSTPDPIARVDLTRRITRMSQFWSGISVFSGSVSDERKQHFHPGYFQRPAN